ISLAAFAEAQQRMPNLQLVAFGQERPSERLPLPDSSRFVFQPAQDQIKDLYASCDAWLFGSRSEGFGLPILEAMACRTPVVATPAGAAPELLAGGGGILVRPQDPKDMARAIGEVAAMSDAAWRAMSDAAYAEATRYT